MITKNYLIILFVVLFFSCDTGTNTEDIITLEGTVFEYDAAVNVVPIEGVLVTAEGLYQQTLTDKNGFYKFEATAANDSFGVTIKATKIGYIATSTFVEVVKGKVLLVPELQMTAISPLDTSNTGGGDDPITSGEAAHIEFVTPHESQVYVYASGLRETAVFGVRVTDAQGNLLDKTHAVQVNFNILNGPDGGEYLDPDTMTTLEGTAFTVLNSGTVAGPVQLEAYIDLPNKTIRSIPSRIAIYGGLPDNDHFSIAVDRVNIAGQVHYGLIDNVTAFVGDKYSNPVVPGTIVYFSTDYGIIEGAASTDDLGMATVRYISAAPLPPNPATTSFANITAWSYGDTITGVTLSTETTILLSSYTDDIEVSPTTFEYTVLNEPKSFTLNISDIYENPIVANSVVSVKATDGELFGDTQFKMLDSQLPGNGTTDFGFVWAPGDSLEAPQVYITITVTAPSDGNGSRSINISGVKKP